jgi:hypothetical protein
MFKTITRYQDYLRYEAVYFGKFVRAAFISSTTLKMEAEDLPKYLYRELLTDEFSISGIYSLK